MTQQQHNSLVKLQSGRFILTVVASISFLIMVKACLMILVNRSQDVDPSQIILLITNMALIIQNVFNSYFSKKRDEDGGTGGNIPTDQDSPSTVRSSVSTGDIEREFTKLQTLVGVLERASEKKTGEEPNEKI